MLKDRPPPSRSKIERNGDAQGQDYPEAHVYLLI